ncbi:MAG: magnesium transporter [Treponema sp.]|nr:magnesium transporter [Treponema sp.]
MKKTYLTESAFTSFRHRIGWLLFLMVSATFTGIIINHFESAISSMVVLTAFIPMLMDTGGNSGSQSSVTIIRALALEEIQFKDFFRVIIKEFLTALLCGFILSAVCFIKILIVDRIILSNENITILVDLTVCLSLFLTIIISKVIGAALPLIAKKLHADPAVMASPLITTISDALSLLVYFGLARCLLW